MNNVALTKLCYSASIWLL